MQLVSFFIEIVLCLVLITRVYMQTCKRRKFCISSLPVCAYIQKIWFFFFDFTKLKQKCSFTLFKTNTISNWHILNNSRAIHNSKNHVFYNFILKYNEIWLRNSSKISHFYFLNFGLYNLKSAIELIFRLLLSTSLEVSSYKIF